MSKLSIEGSVDPHRVTGFNPAISTTASSTENLFLGIDGGASKTHAVVTDSSFNIIGEGHGGPANPARVGVDEAISSIEQAIKEALTQAGVSLRQIASACAALAGVGDPTHHDAMKEALDREFGSGTIDLVTDARAALEGALDGEPGIVVIAGTGSIAMGVDDKGGQSRSGGWGPTLGDEGSGYDIARQALKAVAASFDGRVPRTVLTDLICERLGIVTAGDLPAAIYNGEFEHAEVASLAELVCDASKEGDKVAQSILAEAGRALGDLAVSVIRKLSLEQSAFLVACVGSVFGAGEVLIQPLRSAVLTVAPRAHVGPPLYSPAVGAARLAREPARV